MEKSNHIPYQLSKDQIFQVFETSEEGISDSEAGERLDRTGLNRIRDTEETSWLKLLLNQINNPVIYLLIGAVVISLIFGDIPEAIAILVVILLNTMIGFGMEYQAQSSVNALKKLNRLSTHVRRNDTIIEIDAKKLVPGDFIQLSAGDIVPADARIIFYRELTIDESSLTGESLPVEKNTETIEKEVPLAERKNMIYKGTALQSGKLHAIVTATGTNTEIGRISEMAGGSDKDTIPLNRKLQKLSHRLIWITVGMALLFFIIGWIAGKEIYLLLQTAIAWTVAAIPEGLAIVASIALARGMIRLSRHNVIVKKLAAVETLGETTVIFTDKTGTLTENRLEVNRIEYPGNTIDAAQRTEMHQTQKNQHNEDNSIQQIIKVALLCNDAEKVEGQFKGDPLDTTLVEYVEEIDSRLYQKYARQERLHEDPFDSDSKFMGTVHSLDNKLFFACKGAASPVLERSEFYLQEGETQKLSAEFKETWLRKNDELSEKGLKVLACAFKTEEKKEENLETDHDIFNRLIFLGLVCFADPPKKDVSPAIEKCQRAGIQVIIVTGDHAGTARNIAEKVHLHTADEISAMEGNEIDDSPEKIHHSNLFARVDPRQKYEIVEQFKFKGEVTAMTGDGVNDAPALKKADIGISMGQRGTQIAQEVSDMILQNDSFSSIVEAIEEGRVIFGNIRKFIMYQLSYHLGEILIIAGISFTMFHIPLLPLQLLFLNLLSDVFPALALGLGEGSSQVMQERPKDPEEPVVNKRNWVAISVYGTVMAITVIAVYLISLLVLNHSHETANTIAFFSLATIQLLHVFNIREPSENFFRNQITTNRYIWIALGICFAGLGSAYFVPLIRNTLSLEILTSMHWIMIGLTAAFTTTLLQLIKKFFRI